MAQDKRILTLGKYLIIILLLTEGIYAINLSTIRFSPSVSEEYVPRHHYLATPWIEIGSVKGIAYTPEEAINRANEALGDNLYFAFGTVLLAFLALVFYRRLPVVREICWVSSIILFIFVLFAI